ncbi:MAG: efflux RND transporter periplasmic adaptor subunit, partial [Chitinophagaceae bacterium]|nr:efflux RND transporter periplasmic adaptor subunit [Chitinophagaceae bacterium]
MKKNLLITYTAMTFIMGCSSSGEKTEAPPENNTTKVSLTEQQLKTAGIETGSFTEKAIDETIKVNGVIDVPPQNIVSVSFPTGGYLKSTRLLPGMHVQKGENIAFIEDQSLIQLQQDYLITKSKLKYAQSDYDRQKSLNETKASADKVLQQAQAEFESLRVLQKSLSEKLKLIGISPDKLDENNISRSVAIHSPIDGYVSKVNVNIGKYVQPVDVLFELINPTDIHAALTVFEKDINKLKKGQKVTVSFVNDTTTVYPAEILLITRNVDENRSGTVHCHFEKMPSELRPGMFINAIIYLSGKTVKAAPED